MVAHAYSKRHGITSLWCGKYDYLKSKTPGSGTGHEKCYPAGKEPLTHGNQRMRMRFLVFFREHGISGVTLEDLSLAEQIHLFRNAQGSFGYTELASNLIYMDPEALIDNIHEHPQNAFYACRCFGLDYSRIECKG